MEKRAMEARLLSLSDIHSQHMLSALMRVHVFSHLETRAVLADNVFLGLFSGGCLVRKLASNSYHDARQPVGRCMPFAFSYGVGPRLLLPLRDPYGRESRVS